MNNCMIYIGENKILSNVNISLNENTFLRIKGQNGSGKTVLMNSLLGLNATRVKGKYSIKYDKKDICYITDKPFFFDDESINDVLKMISILYNLKSAEIKEISKILNLSEIILSKKKINELSQGTRKKIHLIPMFASTNKILFLDEIFTGLDLETQQIVVDFIIDKYLHGCLIVIIEHNISIVNTIKERCSGMEEIECKDGTII